MSTIELTKPAGAGATWAKFYEGREGAEYQSYVEGRYAPFIRAIQSRLRHDDMVMELGAGTGTISRALADHNWSSMMKFVATDIDPEMVRLTKARLLDVDVAVFKLDARQNFGHRANVVHSHGMLEHFDDDTIRWIIKTHSYARVQVHYVPGLYDAPTFGDERLMSVYAWWKICKPSQIITFNDGLDYALIFE